ncbi:MAG TPA: hypothetical protein PLE74_03250 [Candidatus Cloacimonadota bacterium]|mgnify:CR=1 FL=1|nr:hypothetical protein [Candidatus Cloacimonadota bacterium]HPT71277.1 hypothetical protein [Candidatus Cloacimonadota bacterium]
MNKKYLLTLVMGLAWIFAAAETFTPRLYIQDYSPVIDNNIIFYKLDKGLDLRKEKPYLVTDFGVKTTEKVDYANQQVKLFVKLNDFPLYPPVNLTFDEYFDNLNLTVFHNSLQKATLDMFNVTSRSSTAGLIPEITLDLPNIAIPKSVRKFLGNKAGKLNLDGSQRLTFTGTSTKNKDHLVHESGQNSNFDIIMRQDLNLSLKGTIGEKIQVSLTHNSNQDDQLFNPNNINVQYKGDEDEIVQSVEMGNITLALSGSRYISYSASSQGLFGVKSKMKLGNLEVTSILSKEEGQKNKKTFTGSSQADSVDISSRSYVNRKIYYIEKPNLLYSLYQTGDLINTDAGVSDSTHCPPGWVNNAIRIEQGEFVANTSLLPKEGTLHVYLDDANSNNDNNTLEGDPIQTTQGIQYVPRFDELTPGVDFDSDYAYDQGIIILNRNIETNYTIAIAYTRVDGVAVPATYPNTDKLHVRVLRTKNQDYYPSSPYNTWDYEVRNMYDLGQTNIAADGFRLDVFTTLANMQRDYNVPDSVQNNGLIRYNDYLHMDTNGDGYVGSGDASIDLAKGFIIIPFIRPFEPLGDLIYTEEPEYIQIDQAKMQINYKGNVARDHIALNQYGIIKGSVKVKVNGEQLRENVDYVMDYDLGEVTFLGSKGKNPSDKVDIDYEFKNGLMVEKKSLMGVRADYSFNDNTKIGGTFIYRTESVSDKHPKIGSENLNLMLADVDGQYSVQPAFITKMIDAVPLIKTTTPSKFTLSGEVAMSIPYIYGNPDTKKQEAYIDDMEGILDVFPLGVMRTNWVPASRPVDINMSRSKTIWYNPDNVYQRDVYDESTIPDKNKNDKVTVMAVKMTPDSLAIPGIEMQHWGGLMKYIGNQIDLSKKKYIEILVHVDDVNENVPPPGPIVMHVDLGNISEDFYTDFGGLHELNTEDGSNEGSNDGVLEAREDVGLDEKANGTTGNDPNDDASSTKVGSDYPYINGTENNGQLDTEDLNNNGDLDELNQYFEYTISLTNNVLYPPINVYKGWKLYRIPLHDQNYVQTITNSINPSLQKVCFARVWFETDRTTRIKFANLDIVGNKWEDKAIRNIDETAVSVSALELNQEEMLVGIADNQKNDHYTPPAGTYEKVDNKPGLEQSLMLEFNHLQSTHMGLVKQIFRESNNLLSYRKLKFFLYPEKKQSISLNPDSINIIMRMGADSTHYYEIRYKTNTIPYDSVMTQGKWKSIEFDFTKLTLLRADSSNVTVTTPMLGTTQLIRGERKDGDFTYAYIGTTSEFPSLNNIKEFSLGVEALRSQSPPYTGIVYFDDIRVTDPLLDFGYAARASLSMIFADFSTLDVEIVKQSPYFNATNPRGSSLTGTFEESTRLDVTNNYYMNKFMPDSWGMNIPLSLKYQYQLGIPKFRSYSDQINIDTEEQKRDERHLTTYSADLGISQTKTPRNWLLAYTLRNITASGNITYSKRLDPTTADTTLSYRENYTYKLDIAKEKLGIKLLKNYYFYFLPKTFNNAFIYNASFPKSYLKDSINKNKWNLKDQTFDVRQLSTDNSFGYDIFSDITSTYRLTTKRDFMIRQMKYKMNVGIETDRAQEINVDYTPQYYENLFTWSNNFNTRYSDSFRQTNAYQNNLNIDNFRRSGNTNRTIRSNLTLKNADLFRSIATKMASHQRQKQSKTTTENSTKHGKHSTSASDVNSTSSSTSGIDIYPQPRSHSQNPYELPQLTPALQQDVQPSNDEELKRKEEMQKRQEMKDNMLKQEEEEKQREMEKLADEKKTEEEKMQEEDKKQSDDFKNDASGNNTPRDMGKSDTEQSTPASSKGNFLSPSRMLLYASKFKNIAFTYQNGYTTSYQRFKSRPNFWYQVGLPHSLADSLLDAQNFDDTYGVNSGFVFSSNLDSDLRYGKSVQKSIANSSQTTITTTFPDVTLTLSEFQKYLHIQNILTSSRLTSTYTLSNKKSNRPVKTIKTITMQPLLAWTANWVNNMTTNLGYNRSYSEDVTDQTTTSKIRNVTKSQSVNGNLSYSFSSEKGIRIPFSKRKIQIKNEMTASLGLNWQKDYNVNYGHETIVNTNTQKISVTPGATYQFNRNIKGGMNSSYELTKNLKKDESLRVFSLSIWMEIQF